MREIGGYFGLEQFAGREYHPNLIGVNSGRNALLYILKARQYRKVYIPRFLCDSVSALCDREGYAWEEYPIGADFLPVFDRDLAPEEALYIVNFYGQVPDHRVLEMKARWGNVIFDNVQDFFRRPLAGVDTVYSCRKFFGVPDGGYAACDGPRLPLDPDSSRQRMTHILGRLEVSGSAFYKAFQENDELFYRLPLLEMSPITRNILRAVDYEGVRTARNENYRLLCSALGQRNPLALTAPDGPYCYPFYCRDGMALKRRLAGEGIYVATLWPNVLVHQGTLEQDYARNILPLPCDQRYGPDDMARMIRTLLSALE